MRGARPDSNEGEWERTLYFVFPSLSTLRVSFFDISDRSESRSVTG